MREIKDTNPPEPIPLKKISAEEWETLQKLLPLNAEIIAIEHSLDALTKDRNSFFCLQVLKCESEAKERNLQKLELLQQQETIQREQERKLQMGRDCAIENLYKLTDQLISNDKIFAWLEIANYYDIPHLFNILIGMCLKGYSSSIPPVKPLQKIYVAN